MQLSVNYWDTECRKIVFQQKYLRDQSKEQQTLTLDELISSLTVDGNGNLRDTMEHFGTEEQKSKIKSFWKQMG